MENDKDGEDRDGGGGQRTGCRYRGGNRDDRDESNDGGDSWLRAKVVVVAAAAEARAVCHAEARAQLATRRRRAAVAAGTAAAARSRGWSCALNGGSGGGGCGYGSGRDLGDGARLVIDLLCTHTTG